MGKLDDLLKRNEANMAKMRENMPKEPIPEIKVEKPTRKPGMKIEVPSSPIIPSTGNQTPRKSERPTNPVTSTGNGSSVRRGGGNAVSSLSKNNSIIYYIIFYLAAIIIFRDIFFLGSELLSALAEVTAGQEFGLDVLYKITIVSLGIVFSIVLFFPTMLINNLKSPISVMSELIATSIEKVGIIKNDPGARNQQFMIIFVLSIILLLTVVLVHFVFLNAFLGDFSNIIGAIAKIGMVYVMVWYMGFFANKIYETYNSKSLEDSKRLNKLLIFAIVYLIGSVIAYQLGTSFATILEGQIENVNQEYNIFE